MSLWPQSSHLLGRAAVVVRAIGPSAPWDYTARTSPSSASQPSWQLKFLPGPVLRLRSRLRTSPACPLAGYGGLGAVVGPGTYSVTGASPGCSPTTRKCSALPPIRCGPARRRDKGRARPLVLESFLLRTSGCGGSRCSWRRPGVVKMTRTSSWHTARAHATVGPRSCTPVASTSLGLGQGDGSRDKSTKLGGVRITEGPERRRRMSAHGVPTLFNRRALRPWRQLFSAIIAAWLASTALVAPAGATVPQGTGALALSTAASCPLPLVNDRYQGFHVGVPTGWDVSTLDGTVAVERDTTGTEAALIYPAALTGGVTPESFFSSYMRYQQQLVAKSGASLTFQLQSDVGGLPRASIRLHSSREDVVGEAGATVLRLRTQFGSEEAVFSVYWAPPARFATDRAMLAEIGQCYGPEPASLFQVFRDQSFTYIMPPGWTTFDEGQDSVDLHGYNNHADVSYLFFGIPPQYNTPSSALAHIFQVIGVTVTSVLSTTSTPSQQTSSGAVQGVEYVEFLGRSEGLAVHGWCIY